MKKLEVAMSLGLRLNSRLLKKVIQEEEKEKKKPTTKITDLERLIDGLVVAPVAFLGRFCVIKDAGCVEVIREILLRAEQEGLSGVDKLRQILVGGLESRGEGGL